MEVHLPGIFVNRIVQATSQKEIEFLTLRGPDEIKDTGDKRSLIAAVSHLSSEPLMHSVLLVSSRTGFTSTWVLVFPL